VKRSRLALVGLVLLAAGCGNAGDDSAGSGGPEIIAAFYPLEFVAAEIAGGNAGVTNLSPPGVEPHDLELAPDQIRSLAQADLVLYIGEGFQPAVEDAVGELSGTALIDGLETQDELIEGGDSHEDELEEGATDPHVWLDPTRVASLGHAVAAEMERIDPDNADVYEDSAVALADALAGLDEEYSAALENCERNELVVSHEAFGYLTERYGLEQVGVSGIDPESEPSPGRMAEVAEFAREHEVTTIFFEEQVAPDIAQAIADEVGAGVEVLDPLEFPPDGGSDYFDVMRTNLDSISSALGCE
jgi:zinc transport system substrate-binding protein